MAGLAGVRRTEVDGSRTRYTTVRHDYAAGASQYSTLFPRPSWLAASRFDLGAEEAPRRSVHSLPGQSSILNPIFIVTWK